MSLRVATVEQRVRKKEWCLKRERARVPMVGEPPGDGRTSSTMTSLVSARRGSRKERGRGRKEKKDEADKTVDPSRVDEFALSVSLLPSGFLCPRRQIESNDDSMLGAFAWIRPRERIILLGRYSLSIRLDVDSANIYIKIM